MGKKKSLKEKAMDLATGEGDDADEDGATIEVTYTTDKTAWKVIVPVSGEDIEDALEDGIKTANKALDNIKAAERMAMYMPQPPQQGQYQQPPAQQQYGPPPVAAFGQQGFQQPAPVQPVQPAPVAATLAQAQLTPEQIQALLAQLGTQQEQPAGQ